MEFLLYPLKDPVIPHMFKDLVVTSRMCAPLLLEEMCLLPQGLGPVKELSLRDMSHKKARDPEFLVDTLVDQEKKSHTPK